MFRWVEGRSSLCVEFGGLGRRSYRSCTCWMAATLPVKEAVKTFWAEGFDEICLAHCHLRFWVLGIWMDLESLELSLLVKDLSATKKASMALLVRSCQNCDMRVHVECATTSEGESFDKPNVKKLITTLNWHQEHRPDWKVMTFVYEAEFAAVNRFCTL